MTPEPEKPQPCLFDRYPGPHVIKDGFGEAFRQGAWFITNDERHDIKGHNTHKVIHRAISISSAPACEDMVGTDDNVVVEFYGGACGRVATSGGFLTAESARQRGYAVDSVAEIKKVQATFCLMCFPEANVKPVEMICPQCGKKGSCNHEKNIPTVGTRYTDAYHFGCTDCGYTDYTAVDGGEAGLIHEHTICPYCGKE